ncbi:MAG TPA: flagellar hook-associated protein FlgL [Rhodothermales bacterium]|nr:flagellar hook-associated protein FlgL [Rhodothermales bacterium]
MNSINLTRERSLYSAFSERAIQLRQSEMAQLQEQMATGLRINRASDDPAGFAEARRMEVLGNRYNQYQQNIQSAQMWVDQSHNALQNLGELFSQAYERGLRVSNATFDQSGAEVEASGLEQTLQQVVDTLNTKSGDEYVFAGSRTTVEPFTLDTATNTVTYNGNDGGRKRSIGMNVSMDVNVNGQAVTDTGDGYSIVESLKNMIDAVRSGDKTALKTALGQVGVARDHVIDQTAAVGTVATRLSLADQQLSDALINVESQRSRLEDTDLAEAITDFQKAQTSFQAALQVTSTLLHTNILEYLK